MGSKTAIGVKSSTKSSAWLENAARFPTQQVGGRDVLELWVAAEELEEFNRHIVGGLREIARAGR